MDEEEDDIGGGEDPGADIDRELDQEGGAGVPANSGPVTRPTRLASSSLDLSNWRPAPGAQPFSPSIAVTAPHAPPSVSGWRPAPGAQAFEVNFGGAEAKPQAKTGVMGEIGRGVMRGVGAITFPIEEAANTVERKLGLSQAEADTAALAQRKKAFDERYAPTVGGVTDINSVGSAGRYIAGKAGEIVPQAAGYIIAGVPRMVAMGALQGATEASEQNNGDPDAALVGAAIGAAAAGAPAHFLFGQAGQGIVRGAARGAAGMAGVNVASEYARPLAGVAAGNPYKAPTADQLSESLATGFLTGVMFGAVGGARTPAPVKRDVTRNTEQLALPAPVADDHEAALQNTLALPPPQKQLPAPSTGYGEGFTMPPPGTPAVPLQPALAGPRAAEGNLLTAPDMQRGVSGEGFTVQQPAEAGEPAKPSGGMNRGNLVEQLTQLGEDPKTLRRMKINDLRDAYDQKMAQPEATRQEFRPPVIPESDHPVDQAAAKAAGEPTPAQAEAGNYQKGHVSVQGLDISIETPQGGVRRGPLDENGKPAWEATMPAHYGYIKGTVGGDGEHVDVTMGPRTKALFDGKPSEAAGEPVFIVDQIDPKTGKFDEHKALIGFHTREEATRAYDESFSDGSGPSRRGAVTEKTFGDFKDWLQGDTTKPVAYKKPTVGEQLQTRRQVQKARMAEPTTIVEPPARVAKGSTSDEAVKALWDKLQSGAEDQTLMFRAAKVAQKNRALRSVEDLQELVNAVARARKAEPAKVQQRVRAAVSDFIRRKGIVGSASDARAHEVVAALVKRAEGKVTLRPEVARLAEKYRKDYEEEARGDPRRLERQLEAFQRGYDDARAGKDNSTSSMSARNRAYEDGLEEGEGAPKGDVAAEVENQPQVYEHETAGPTTVVREGVAERQRSPQTSNLDRRLGDLEQKVLNGELSAHEASQQYSPMSAKAKHPDFASWLRHRIEQAPDLEQKALARAEKLKDLPKGQRDAQMRVANKDLSRNSPDAIEKLKKALKELEEPSETPAEKAQRESRKSAALERIQAARKKLAGKKDDVARSVNLGAAKLFQDERINRPVRELTARPGGLHEYLDRIANDPVIRVRLPQAVALARRIREMLPNLAVWPSDVAAKQFPERATIYSEENLAGLYDPKHDHIVLNPKGPVPLETVLHESMHAITTAHLRVDSKNSASHQVLDTIREEFNEAHPELSEEEKAHLQYALSNNEELHTMLMTDPVVQQVAARIIPSSKFRDRMSQLGYQPQESRSVWKTFTGWVRRVVGLTPASDSLLDHILRPLEDITDRADQFNRSLGDPVENVVSDAISAHPRFDQIKDEVIRRADPKGLGLRLYKGVLQGATGDGIVKRWRALFEPGNGPTDKNSLEQLRAAREAVGKGSKDFHDAWSETAEDLTKHAGKLDGAERERVGQLMNDATLAQARLGNDALSANAHLTKPEDQAALRSLQSRYNALSTEAKKVYNGFRDYYRSTHELERDESLRDVVKRFIPDASKDQVEALGKAVKTKGGIKELIDNPDASEVAAKFADQWDRNRALVRQIARLHNLGFVQGDYFPLRRYGDWVVHYGDKGDDYGVEMFERRGEAEARREQLRKAGAEPSQVLSKRESKLRYTIPTAVMEELDAGLRRKGLSVEDADAARDTFASIWLQHANRSEMARSRMRRQGVKGASTEFIKTMSRDFLATQARMGHLKAGADVQNALEAMRRHVDWLGDNGKPGDQINGQAVLNEMQSRQTTADDDFSMWTGIGQKMSHMGFVYSLMSPSHMLTSTIEAHENATVMLGSRHGVARSGLLLGKALKEIAPAAAVTGAKNSIKAVRQGLKAADWNLSTMIRDRFIAAGADRGGMIRLFNELNNAGLIDHTFVREFQRIAGLTTNFTKGWYGKFLDLNGAMAHAVDAANKSAIAKAAYDLELSRTGSVEQAVKYAVDTARDAMPNYNIANKSRISTQKGVLGGLAAPLTQFKQYGIHMYNVMGALLHQSMNGATKAEKREATKAFAGMLATHALMAGTLTLIADPLRYVMGAYDWITGAAKPHDYQNDVRSWIADAFGPEIGEVVSRGLPHAAGFDIHRRVGLSNLLEIPELKSFDAKGWGEMVAAAMTGASGQDAVQMADGMHKLMPWNFDLMGALKGLAPRPVRDVGKAINLANKGVTDSKGKTILPPEKLSSADIAYQALGFQPSRVSEFREGRNAILEAREEQVSARSKVMTAFMTAAPSDRHSVIEQVREYNREHPQEPITYSQLLQGVKRQQEQARQPATFGVHVPKKATREMGQHGSFANTH